ncbi:alpha-ketoglutarate-dependent dioxygenase AlkB [Leptothoe spongobia]|uniref:Alpha-ketoglutarate-dependent dioxygenase AlkB n=1 Tax=Leptothoe spongobia TAU-MAC 1115 TaxID=1967444 RepID=A0A947DBB1_9CYAN|nr:alpha-ketoglutarate-dependent dioxygenase AlkB [Leptothoe spongobia]MBT9314092.1 alpha-ketoglutarate-dependent dioxygenase AlkB [Leptothoe spongobia TAU-MAC 1115]
MKPLPLDCEAFYHANFLGITEAEALFDHLVSGFNVTNKMIKMGDGSEQIGALGKYLFMDPELTSFDVFHQVWGERSAWTDSLASVRDRIAQTTGVRFPVARCVYYKDGTQEMEFHRDLSAYGNTDEIASLSLGAEREFTFRRISDPAKRFTLRLAPGSLLFMGVGCQDKYEHGLLAEPQCRQARLNLTFRKYGWE